MFKTMASCLLRRRCNPASLRTRPYLTSVRTETDICPVIVSGRDSWEAAAKTMRDVRYSSQFGVRGIAGRW